MCRLIQVSFPLDLNGLPDFQDAWSASIQYLETDSVMSAFSVVKIRDLSTGTYVDPFSKKKYSAAVILAHPNDIVLTQIYACLSTLPSLQGLIQSFLVSGGYKVFPAIVPGLQASCLLYFIRKIKEVNGFTQSE